LRKPKANRSPLQHVWLNAGIPANNTNRRLLEHYSKLRQRPGHASRHQQDTCPRATRPKRYQRQFGDALVCVRYRINPETARRYTTVEIVMDEKQLPGFPALGGTTDGTLVALAITHGETELRQRVKQAGARWDQNRKAWIVPYRFARQ
jgi:hypothetical protein